jgi:hypothetical protein
LIGRLFLWFGAVATLAACAIQESPPGGPVDTRAAAVIATFPRAGSSGASPATEVIIEFDEGMSRSRFARFVVFSPGATIGKVRWKKNRVILVPEEPLHPDTTYVVEIKPGVSDAHGVRSSESYRFAFATSAAIDSGSISGQVFFRRKLSEKAVVRLFRLPRDTSFTPEATRPDREVTVDREGAYRFGFLPTEESDFIAWAFEDANGNGAFERDNEADGEPPDSVLTLTDRQSVLTRRDIYIVDPREPAEITGRIVYATGADSFPIAVTMHAVLDTMPPTFYSRCDADGNYRLDKVLRGRYTLWAFLDFESDSLCGTYPCPDDTTRCLEPCARYPDTLVVEPGQKIRLEDLDLPNGRTKGVRP